MKLQIKEKFPCGYEIEINATAWTIDFNDKEPKLGTCPLHGKECKKKEEE